jgi:hypothetical protein
MASYVKTSSLCYFLCYILQKWVQRAATNNADRLKIKITRHKEMVNADKTHNIKAAEIPPPSTLQNSEPKCRDKEKYTEERKISSEDNTQGDLRNNPNWAKDLLVWQRLFTHHTLSSTRHFATFVCCKTPQDKLDLVLDSTYRHEAAIFPHITDIYRQPETLGYETW